MTINVSALYNKIAAAGIPIVGVSNPDDVLAHVIVQFDVAATQPQKDAAAVIVANFVDPLIADNANLSDIQTRWLNSPIHGKTPTEIYTLMQGQVDGWTTLAQAKADLRVWIPLLTAVLAWTIMKEQQR